MKTIRGYEEMKILLTGSTGYIASNLLNKLLILKHEVYVIVRQDTDKKKIDKRLDDRHRIIFNSPQQLCEAIQEVKPDVFIHLATLYQYDYTIEDISVLFEANIIFATIVLDAVMRAGCHRMINTSSIMQHYKNDIYDPTCLYAAAKESFEKIIDYYVKAHNFSVITLEITDTYGPEDTRNKIFNLLLGLSEGQSLNMSRGEQYLNMCYIDDIVTAYIEALNQIQENPTKTHQKFLVRGEESIQLKELIAIYQRISEKVFNINWGAREYRTREIMKPWLGRPVLPNWVPQVSLCEGIKKVIEMREQIYL